MKNGFILIALLSATALVLLWQSRQADAVSTEITALKSQREQVVQETELLRAALEKSTAEAAEHERQKELLEQAALRIPHPLAPSPAATSAGSLSTTRPEEYYWSDAGDTAWVPKDCLPQLDIRVFGLDPNHQWRITDHAVAALVLSATEHAALEQTLAAAVQRYHDLARAQFSQVIGPTPEDEAKGLWRAQYRVRAFPGDAAALRKEFAAWVSDLLQGEKAKLFLDLMAKWTDTPFSPFGRKEMTILFEWTRTADDQWALQVTETGRDNSRPVKCGQATTRRLDQTNIPPYWRHLIQPPAS